MPFFKSELDFQERAKSLSRVKGEYTKSFLMRVKNQMPIKAAYTMIVLINFIVENTLKFPPQIMT